MKSSLFFKGLSWLIILNLLVKPAWVFFIDRQVQNIVGFEAFGSYFALLNLSYVLFFIADAGLSNMLNQRIANNNAVNLKQLLQLKFVLLVIYCIVFCTVGWLTHIEQWDILIAVVLIQILTSLFLFLRSIITAHQYFSADAIFSVIDKLLMILLCGSVIYTSFFGSINLLLYLKVQVACTAIAISVAFVFILKKQLIILAPKENVLAVLKKIMPFTVIILLMSVHYRLDAFLLERIHPNGAYEAGVYASAYRLLDAANMIGYLAASFLVPFIAKHFLEKETVQDVILNTRHGLLFFSTGLVSFVVMYAPWLQNLLYHSTSGYNSFVIQLCIAALPGYCLVHVYGAVLTAIEKFRPLIVILIISVVLNIGLNLFLIPAYGALGCCFAALASQYVCGIAVYFTATKKINVSYGFRSVFIYCLLAILLFALFYFAKTALINVWIILAIAVGLTLLTLTTQVSHLKKLFVSLR
jgi:O-antigen/teichoic acid export membrane protein